MLTEQQGKGGCVCQAARRGELKCPLIIRPTSEDVITGNLFGGLANINPRRWLPHMLNQALGTTRFRQQIYRNFRIDLWRNRPPYPPHLLPWKEGMTQVDVTIRWENPPTTIYVEMKFLSDLSPKTSGDDGSSGYPSDQLIRNIRVGLLECGWFAEDHLFSQGNRDFAVVLLSPKLGHPLIESYRNTEQLRQAIPHSHRLIKLPTTPLVGELSYGEVANVLDYQQRFATVAERKIIGQLIEYLAFKNHQVTQGRTACLEGVAP